jgi:hypothetical protein
MNDFNIVEKVVNRILKSEKFLSFNSTWIFDENLQIERYNGLYKVSKDGIVLGHYHGRDTVNPELEKLHDAIYFAIEKRKAAEKEKILNAL